jgi:hypothetical protein
MKLLNELISSFKQNVLAMVDPTEDEIRCKNICIKMINNPDSKLAYSSKSAERLVYLEDENIYINMIDRDIHIIYEYEVFKFFISHQNTHLEIIAAFDNKMASKFDVFYDLSNYLKENFLTKVESF